ncbi:NfeD family protein [Sphingobium sp. DEHP117]|uniref:NfeD family protein n=1 Tax=Sphingobium sp. DEHP117 TaxID=2993436 RepID=UPI0027D48DC0|nr:NfeD family protein [Sphingobium sp. DEHP117]MDQ4419730.1 NfeD family protein [Sphingobium sp. DEHP117]
MDGLIDQLVHNPWWWLALAVLLAIAEIITPGVFLIFVAGAAAITGVLAMIVTIPPAVQFVIFAGLSLACVALGRRWYAGHADETQDPLLNDRAARLIGRTVTVVEPIVNGEGRVRVDDGTWSAAGPDAVVGTRLTIVAVNGPRLTVDWPTA